MAEATPGLGDIAPKSQESAIQLAKPESAPKKNRTPLKGSAAKVAGAALAAGLAFGVSPAIDQGGIRPASAQGETRTPTPTSDPQIEAQKTRNAQMAATATSEARARQTEQARVDELTRLQNEFNRIQDARATQAAQGRVLTPPERAAATRQAQLNDQATRIANADAQSTQQAATATRVATVAAATATEGTKRAIETATKSAEIVKEEERVRKAYSPEKAKGHAGKAGVAFLGLVGLSTVAIGKFRRNTWGRLKALGLKIWKS